jgi:hypothetical protein
MRDIKIYNVVSKTLLFRTPTVIEPEPDEKLYIVGIGCRPTSEWKPASAQSGPLGAITGLDITPYVELGQIVVRFDDVDRVEHATSAWVLMDRWWQLHHVDPHAAAARAGGVIRHLEAYVRRDAEAKGPSLVSAADVKALGDAIASAGAAYDEYMTRTAPTTFAMPIVLEGSEVDGDGRVEGVPTHHKLCIERRESTLGGLGPLMSEPLDVELIVLSKRPSAGVSISLP